MKSWVNLSNDDPEDVIESSKTYDVQDGRVWEYSTYGYATVFFCARLNRCNDSKQD